MPMAVRNWSSTAGKVNRSRRADARSAPRLKFIICSSTRPCDENFCAPRKPRLGHASEAFTRVALAYPQIHFTLRHQDKPVYDLPPASNWSQRIAAFFGAELAEALIAVESSDGDVRLTGFAAHPSPHAQPSADAVCVPQRPGHPRSGFAACIERGLPRADSERPLSDCVFAHRNAAGRGRRECASDQARSAVSRFRPTVQPTVGHAAHQVFDDRFDDQVSRTAIVWRRRLATTRTIRRPLRTNRPRCKNGKSWWLGRRESWRGRS